jgi:hypothetical protein
MPLISELSTSILSHYFSADYLASRSPGPHLKTIIDDFLEYHDLYNKRRADFADSLEEFASIGFAWERAVTAAFRAGGIPNLDEATPLAVRRVYEHAFSRALNEGWQESHPREIVKPGEVTHRGIHCTGDGINVRGKHGEEWKATWTSAAGGLERHPDWLMQMPGYCEAYGFDSWVVRAFYVNGYYEKGQMGKPVTRSWYLRWSPDELEENWQTIETHKLLMIEEGRMTPMEDTES